MYAKPGAQPSIKEELRKNLNAIIDSADRYVPIISEYQFKREVLDILENPFGRENLTRYLNYVGELTSPLKVVDDNDQKRVLFTVPPIMQSFRSYIPGRADLEAEVGFTNDSSRVREVGGDTTGMTIEHFSKMSTIPDYVENVILPIREILAQYDRKMIYIPAVDGKGGKAAPDTPPPSSFSEEYE